MKRLIKSSSLFVSVMVGILLLSGAVVGHAEGTNGGGVQTQGGISFYEDSTEASSSTVATTESSTVVSEPTVTSDSSIASITKPYGKYPSTGELVTKGLGIGGLVLVLLVLLFLLLKRKKEHKEEEV